MHGNSKYTAERGRVIVDALRAGNMRRTAAHKAGIHLNTLSRWLEKGFEDGTGALFEFAVQVHTAEADAEMDAVKRLHKENPGWWLSRRNKDWSERKEVTGADGEALKFVIEETEPPDAA